MRKWYWAGMLLLAAVVMLPQASFGAPVESANTTLNNISARVLEPGRVRLRVGARYFGSHDWAGSGSLRVGMPFGMQAGVTINGFQTDNDGRLGSQVVSSRWNGVEIALKKNLIDSGPAVVALQVGAEIRDSKAIIRPTGVSTTDNSAVWSIAVPASWDIGDNVRVSGTIKTAFFPSGLNNSAGARVDAFGTLVGATAGSVVALSERWALAADVTGILAGDNSISDSRGRPKAKVLWSASLLGHLSDRVDAEAFLANTAGTSVATSLMAASGGSTAFGGVRLGFAF